MDSGTSCQKAREFLEEYYEGLLLACMKYARIVRSYGIEPEDLLSDIVYPKLIELEDKLPVSEDYSIAYFFTCCRVEMHRKLVRYVKENSMLLEQDLLENALEEIETDQGWTKETVEARTALVKGLLTEHQWDVLVLKDGHELTFRQIALKLGRASPSSIKYQYEKAKDAIDKGLK